MYKIEKYKWEDRHNHYWSSDWHNFHDPKWDSPIWEMRGHSSASEAAEKQKELINSRVGENDILWFLGDGFLNASDEQCLEWLGDIKCKNIKYLFGNHESNIYRLYKKQVVAQYGLENVEVYPLRMGNVEFIGNQAEIEIGKQKIVMNHFPLRIHNACHRYSWHVSGHSHLNDPERRPEFQLGKTLDVGIDYGDIWSFDQLADIMSTKDVNILDHAR